MMSSENTISKTANLLVVLGDVGGYGAELERVVEGFCGVVARSVEEMSRVDSEIGRASCRERV